MLPFKVEFRESLLDQIGAWDLPHHVTRSLLSECMDILESPQALRWIRPHKEGHSITIEVDHYEFILIFKFYDETFHVLVVSYSESA